VEAHRLNVAAANALLKVLEEPPKGTYLILQTSAPAALLPTIRSRVQWVRCPIPEREVALAWMLAEDRTADQPAITRAQAELALNLAGGEPCQAMVMAAPEFLQSRSDWLGALRQQILQPSAHLQALTGMAQADPKPILSTWSHWLADMVRLGQSGDKVWVQHTDQLESMQALVDRYDATLWLVLFDAVIELQTQVGQANNLNWQLLLEGFWLRIPREVRKLTKTQRAGSLNASRQET
ncbi:MAG: DNA polymerase III subunit delta' C-terminal domain-containing protein, partial [Natronospirillum sp.]